MELVNKVLTYWYSYFPPTLLHLAGFLLTLNCDARNHEFKISKYVYENFLISIPLLYLQGNAVRAHCSKYKVNINYVLAAGELLQEIDTCILILIY